MWFQVPHLISNPALPMVEQLGDYHARKVAGSEMFVKDCDTLLTEKHGKLGVFYSLKPAAIQKRQPRFALRLEMNRKIALIASRRGRLLLRLGNMSAISQRHDLQP